MNAADLRKFKGYLKPDSGSLFQLGPMPSVDTQKRLCFTQDSTIYSELNLNQYSVGSPCRNVCTVCGSPPCPDLNLIHYTNNTEKAQTVENNVFWL